MNALLYSLSFTSSLMNELPGKGIMQRYLTRSSRECEYANNCV
jgi:hypothetical protein